MRILVSGRDGQVARSLAERGPAIDWIFAARPDCDLAQPGSFAAAIEAAHPDLVINAAAYTAVDRAEEEEALAHRINAEAAGEGAETAARLRIPFIHLSTDFVFDGSGSRAWREEDPIAPLNAYGRTKAEGERLVLAADPAHLVVRTSWVVSSVGHNFIKTILRLAGERDELAVVDDQLGCPTSALDLAGGLIAMAQSSDARGVIHLAGSGEASWADLAEQVMTASADAGGPIAQIRRIASKDFPTPAQRPNNSVLDCSKARGWGLMLPDWKASVTTIVERLITVGP